MYTLDPCIYGRCLKDIDQAKLKVNSSNIVLENSQTIQIYLT